MQCPRDNTSFTVIRFNAYFETLEIDVCPNCLGMWLDRNELAQIARLYKPLDTQGELKRWAQVQPDSVSQHTTARTESPFSCPHGHGVMERNPYAGDSRMFVDRCTLCCGVWFDGREAVLLWNTLAPHSAHDDLVRAFGIDSREKKLEEQEAMQFLQILFQAPLSKIGFMVFLAYLLRLFAIDTLHKKETEKLL